MNAVLFLALALLQPKGETITIPGTTFTFEMVQLPGGSFKSGAREIDVKPFRISSCEVTWEAFEKFFMDRKAVKVDGVTRPSPPYEPPHGAMGVGSHPAVGMRWHGAMAYCEWLSRLTGRRFRLPTEAEWEYAARAGSTADSPPGAADAAWCKENSQEKTHPVGQKKANAFGLHDMMGNVWEYMLEPWAPPEYAPVLRGGAWNTPAQALRFSQRQAINPEWFDRDPNRPRSMWWLTDGPFVGFRVAEFVDPQEKSAQEAYVPEIQIADVKVGDSKAGNTRVTGAIQNAGRKTLDEVELLVFYVDSKGKPVWEDNKSRPGYSKAYPVLVNSFHDGVWRKPLGPGERRTFAVDVPVPYDLDEEAVKAGARVAAIQFSRP